MEDFTGIALKRPRPLCPARRSSCISLIGIPFTGGFFGKFYAFSAAVHSGHVWLAIVGLANSGVACFYYLRLLTALYSRPLTDSLTYVPSRKLTIPAAIALTATAAATLGLGILPGRLLHLVQRATPTTIAATTTVADR